MRLMATHFWKPPGPSMRARCTLAMPPTPISSTTRYRPKKKVAELFSASLARGPECDDGVPELACPPARGAAGRGGGWAMGNYGRRAEGLRGTDECTSRR